MSALPLAVKRQVDEAEDLQKRLVAAGFSETMELLEQVSSNDETPLNGVSEMREGTSLSNSESAVESVDDVEDHRCAYASKYDDLQKQYEQEMARLRDEMNNKERELIKSKRDFVMAQLELSALSVEPEVQELQKTSPEVYNAVNKMLFTQLSRLQTLVIDALDKKIESVRQAQADVLRNLFNELISEKVPNWKTIKKDTDFNKWLSVTDRYTGKTRQELFNAAFDRFDAVTVANFFKDYAYETKNSSKKKGLELYAGLSRTSASRSYGADVESFKETDIQKFYNELSAGKYSGREKEAMLIEERIAKAMKAGRIISK
ncbi:MAG: hypothetical protein L3V56_13080 [Candidatus Magnetoovum sp. WYHC-5]|nr:hypothetical protein [Candidatus Magnetoovum sp. WYHC-5]